MSPKPTMMPVERPKPSAFTPVALVCEHDGVGNALRSAYLPRVSDVPTDIMDLLDKLR